MPRKLAFILGSILVFAALFAALSACTPSLAATALPTAAATNTLRPAQAEPTAAAPTYTLHGITPLSLAVALPAQPAEAAVYLAQPGAPATLEGARALADQFGMAGEIYAAPGNSPNATGYLVVDGNRRLVFQSENGFIYYPDVFNYWLATAANASAADAEAQIADFMRSYGFGADYRVIFSEVHSAYYALPLTPDGFPLRHSHFTASGFLFSLNSSGIFSVDARLINYEPVGTYGIISAEEAFTKALEYNGGAGILEGSISPDGAPQAWVRTYPQDETVTIFGYLNSAPSAEGGDPLVTMDGYTVTGNVDGIEATLPQTFVSATGRFHNEGDADVFILDSWQVYDGYSEGVMGTLQSQGDDVVLVTDDQRELLMPDVPADVPLPLADVYAMGVTRGDTFEWNAFDMRMADGGGGGGGGEGVGLYKLNLTGTPVPMPTEVVSQTVQVGQVVEGQRGLVSVTFYNQPDGSQRVEYSLYFSGGQVEPAMILQGEGLETLQAMHNRPVDVWGSISAYDEQFGLVYLDVERFEIPYPDLQFQILRGAQRETEIDGQAAILFTTTDGQTYTELTPRGDLETFLIGIEGDEVLCEALLLPDEAVGGHAAMRCFSGGVAPEDGQAIDMEITADQPYVEDEPVVQDYVPPTVTIESVELVYFIEDPRLTPITDSEPAYIQPMWRFAGRNSNGELIEILVQALQEEFLLPEVQTIVGPG